jgi:exopolysaccharide production repressor protein
LNVPAHANEGVDLCKRDAVWMTVPFVLRWYVCVLLTFAVVTYVLTDSLRTALVQTVICAVLIQIGYFIAVVFLVWGTKRRRAQDEILPGACKQRVPSSKR